jgi:hypothetical protein
MSKLVKVHNPAGRKNPSLALVNPYGKAKKKPRRNPSRVKKPDVAQFAATLIAAGFGAIGTTLIANLLPLPTNKLMNGVAKGVIAGGLGWGASKINFTKNHAVAITAGGAGTAMADTLRNFVPSLRTIFVPTEPAVAVVKEASEGQINDVVVDELMGDVIDSWPYPSVAAMAAAA